MQLDGASNGCKASVQDWYKYWWQSQAAEDAGLQAVKLKPSTDILMTLPHPRKEEQVAARQAFVSASHPAHVIGVVWKSITSW